MKLIHTADLHLDSPMESNLSPEKARERKSELLGTLSRMVSYALENDVKAILIAGDLFDSARVTQRTGKYVTELIANNPQVNFYYLAGNHDAGGFLREKDKCPGNLFLFSDAWTTYDLYGVKITGSESPNPETLLLSSEHVNLVLLHGQETHAASEGVETVPLPKYKGKNIDYLALGHIHEYRTEALDGRGVVCYSGCPEGRGFDECGEKGFVLLDVEGKKIKSRFVPFARRTLHTVRCDVSTCNSQLELEKCVNEAVKNIPEKDLVKVVLTGDTPEVLQKDLAGILRELSDRFYFAKLYDESKIAIRPEDYLHDLSLRGEFVRGVLASDLSETEKSKILSCGFSALAGEEIVI